MPNITQAHGGKLNQKKLLKRYAKEKITEFRDNPGSYNSVASLREIIEAIIDYVGFEV